jgi:tripartite-type tricarboxylate transporter receptor subunit TctC
LKEASLKTLNNLARRLAAQQILALSAVGVASSANVRAQATFPSQPIKIVVGFPPGSTADQIFRQIADRLAIVLKERVIIDNRAGASGLIAAEYVAKASPDGYTILGAPSSSLTSTPQTMKKAPVEVFKDFVGISMVTDWDYVLVANSKVPANNLAQLLSYAKANPGKLTYGSPGLGSALNISVAILEQMANVDFLHIPYKGGPQLQADLVGGQIDFTVSSLALLESQIKTGQLRALGVTGLKRNPQIPNVPTFIESGVANYEMRGGHLLVAPIKTTKDVLDKIHSAVAQVMASKEIKDNWTKMGMNAVSTSLAETATTLKVDYERYGKIIRERNLYAS